MTKINDTEPENESLYKPKLVESLSAAKERCSKKIDDHINRFQANTFSPQGACEGRVDRFGNPIDTFGNPIKAVYNPPISPQAQSILDKLVPLVDPVNHPPHYKKHPSGIECITITREMNFNLGNALKYIWRSGEKGNVIQDLEKAIWYLKDEIKRLTPP